jgi:hypothetical protein
MANGTKNLVWLTEMILCCLRKVMDILIFMLSVFSSTSLVQNDIDTPLPKICTIGKKLDTVNLISYNVENLFKMPTIF